MYIDRNYGGIFIIWDRLFGSFQEELPEEPCIYGIRKALGSYNPFWANVHVYWSVFQDSWHARRWQDKFMVWFKGPGWRPAGLDLSHPVKRIPLEDFNKYAPPVSTAVRIYAFFQFFFTTLAATGMLVAAGEWKSTPLLLSVVLLFFSFYLQSAWTEGKSYAPWLEWLKLGMVFALTKVLPINTEAILVLQIYLLFSVIFLAWLMRKK